MSRFTVAVCVCSLLLSFANKRSFSQEHHPEFEYTYSIPDAYSNCRSCVELDNGGFMLVVGDVDAQILKLSSEGALLNVTSFPKPPGHRFHDCPKIVNAHDKGIIVIGSFQPLTPDSEHDEAVVFFNQFDEDLNLVEYQEETIKIDTTPDCIPIGMKRLTVFSVVNGDDGIWACLFKQIPNCPQPEDNDSILFWKYDYTGNHVETKCKELYNNWNEEAVWHKCVCTTETGYKLVLVELKNESGYGRRELVVQEYDKDFNFISETERAHNNPDHNLYASSLALNTDSILVASYFQNAETYGTGVALAIYNSQLKKKKYLTFSGSYGWDAMTATYSSIDFMTDGRVCLAYTDHYEIQGYNDYDSWLAVHILTRDLLDEQTFYYDLKDEKSFMKLNEVICTKDGGLLLTGLYKPDYDFIQTDAFVVKFPAEAFVGIEEAHANGLKVAVAYPNPGNATLNIRTALKDATVEVYDLQGRMVAQQTADGIVTAIATEDWPSGVYLWKVLQDGNLSESGKWVKE